MPRRTFLSCQTIPILDMAIFVLSEFVKGYKCIIGLHDYFAYVQPQMFGYLQIQMLGYLRHILCLQFENNDNDKCVRYQRIQWP